MEIREIKRRNRRGIVDPNADRTKFNKRKPYKKRTHRNVRRKFHPASALCLTPECGKRAVWPKDNPKFCTVKHAALEGLAYTTDHWCCEMCGKWYSAEDAMMILCRVIMCQPCKQSVDPETRDMLEAHSRTVGGSVPVTPRSRKSVVHR